MAKGALDSLYEDFSGLFFCLSHVIKVSIGQHYKGRSVQKPCDKNHSLRNWRFCGCFKRQSRERNPPLFFAAPWPSYQSDFRDLLRQFAFDVVYHKKCVCTRGGICYEKYPKVD